MSKVADAVFGTIIPAGPTGPIFTTSQTAQFAKVGEDVASRDLGRLASRGLITRITRGIWADTRHPDFSPYAVVPVLIRAPQTADDEDAGRSGYVSLTSALNLRGMIQQVPRVIHVIVPSQRPVLKTAIGVYEFHKFDRALLGGAEPFGALGRFDVATSAKALFDTLYVSARRGRRFAALPELTFPRDFLVRDMEQWIRKITHVPLRTAVEDRWCRLKTQVERRHS